MLQNSPFFRYLTQQGFTLVELLTVMLILVALASITVETSKDFVFQQRYEVTKDRYQKIKKAIIGDPNQVINGQPNIEGFVKDMGRLPNRLEELLGNVCEDATYTTQTTCTANGKQWLTRAYLSASDLKDGWANSSVDGNYGWNVVFPSTTSMTIQSKGKNGNINVADTGYDEDYPKAINLPSIKENDWMINLDGIQVNVIAKMATSPTASCNVTISDPATCTLTDGTWTSASCSNLTYITQADCESNSAIWTAGSCATYTTPTSKLGCESVGGAWNYGTPSNLCIKITKDSKSYIAGGTLPTIIENGRIQLINFPSIFHDSNGNLTKDTGENLISMGTATIKGIYTACDFITKYNDTSPTRAEIQINLIPNTTLPTINW